jgi:hypothetical protein
MTKWLINGVGPLDEGLLQWQHQLEGDLDASGKTPWNQFNVTLAMLAGIQGNVDESERLINLWLGPEQFDWADRNELRHEACRALGMIGATQATVKCIQDGLEEPSHVHPFLEPYLPFYDTIRDQPEFLEMLAEIDPERSFSKNY